MTATESLTHRLLAWLPKNLAPREVRVLCEAKVERLTSGFWNTTIDGQAIIDTTEGAVKRLLRYWTRRGILDQAMSSLHRPEQWAAQEEGDPLGR